MGIFWRSRRRRVDRIAAQLGELQSQLGSLRKDAARMSNGLSKTAGAAMGTAGAAYHGVGKWTSFVTGAGINLWQPALFPSASGRFWAQYCCDVDITLVGNLRNSACASCVPMRCCQGVPQCCVGL